MVTLLRASVLSDDEKALMVRLSTSLSKRAKHDARMDAYYEGRQRLDQIGLAVPPELRRFETVVNWPRAVVDEVARRLDVRGFVMPGEDDASEVLREGWEVNNLDSDAPLLSQETMITGRGFVTVGANEDDEGHPLIRVEPSRQMAATVDARTRQMLGLLRSYKDADRARRRTLMLPNSTVWLRMSTSGWRVEDRDDHGLGRVPAVMFLNRRRPGEWWGESEMTDVIPITDAAARTLTNLQVAQEGLAVPGRYIFGVDPSKMVDAKTGKPVPVWEAYYTALMVHANSDARAGQFTAADLKNFTETVNHYGQLAASVSGLPIRYFVVSTTNPAAEGAIRADESRLVKNAERKQTDWGDGWGWVMGLYVRLRTNKWPETNRISTLWFDPGTPTFSQRADAVQKLAGGRPLLSRRGAWTELGWSKPRMDTEQAYFDAESEDPYVTALAAKDVAALAAVAPVPPVTPPMAHGPAPVPAVVG